MAEETKEVFVGIDVSKEQLDVAVGEDGAFWSISNDGDGLQKLVERLKAQSPTSSTQGECESLRNRWDCWPRPTS